LVIEADISHIKQIAEIEKENFQNPWSYDLICGEFKNKHSGIYVFINRNKVSGYIIYRWILDEVELLDLSVKKDLRRLGIAENLLDFLMGQSGNCNIFLEVKQDNDSAINLYKKKGFRQVGLRKDYYSKGVNAFVMKLYVQGVQDVKDESECRTGFAGNQSGI